MDNREYIKTRISQISEESFQLLDKIKSNKEVDIFSALYRINQKAHEIEKILTKSNQEL